MARVILELCVLKVCVLTEDIDRDTIKNNIRVLTLAGQSLGLRVGIKTCEVHVKALYEYMRVPCPSSLTQVLRSVSRWSSQLCHFHMI